MNDNHLPNSPLTIPIQPNSNHLEIERKFLILSDDWKKTITNEFRIAQGYLKKQNPAVRVRIKGDKGYLTIKESTAAIAKKEFEYEIPVSEASEMLSTLCEPGTIDKTRYLVPFQGFTWEIDIFHGDNDGLSVAEVELRHSEDLVPLPPWVGREVSHDRKYANSSLSSYPYSEWNLEERGC